MDSVPGSDAERNVSVDAGLLRRIKTGDLDAYEAFFERHRAAVYRTALAITGDSQLAEEVLQDTFVRAYERRDTLREDVSPVPWLCRVALNFCRTRLARPKTRWEPITDAVVRLVHDTAARPDEQVERMELREIVRDGIMALSPRHQAVVVLYYLHGLSLQETAEILGLPVGTVKSRLHYGLEALRTRLGDDRRFGGAYHVAIEQGGLR